MDKQQYEPALEQVERKILASVKFIDVVLKEIRNQNKGLQDDLGMSYAKHIGLVSPFEEAIHSLRKVRGELDSYLKKVREDLVSKYKRQYSPKERKQPPQSGSPKPRTRREAEV